MTKDFSIEIKEPYRITENGVTTTEEQVRKILAHPRPLIQLSPMGLKEDDGAKTMMIKDKSLWRLTKEDCSIPSTWWYQARIIRDAIRNGG